ncbi:MAG TPA: hypothetical protein VL948_18985 [Verrucomicrobiae bacterium]|jgi:hypothetical protein|nr:hypothetical protein [Verrucomicrobiae bacterium]
MTHILFSLPGEAVPYARGMADTSVLIQLGIVILLTALVIGRLVDALQRPVAERAKRDDRGPRPHILSLAA